MERKASRGASATLDVANDDTSYRGHTATVLCLTIVGKEMFTGSKDQTIMTWNLKEAKPHVIWRGKFAHNGPVRHRRRPPLVCARRHASTSHRFARSSCTEARCSLPTDSAFWRRLTTSSAVGVDRAAPQT